MFSVFRHMKGSANCKWRKLSACFHEAIAEHTNAVHPVICFFTKEALPVYSFQTAVLFQYSYNCHKITPRYKARITWACKLVKYICSYNFTNTNGTLWYEKILQIVMMRLLIVFHASRYHSDTRRSVLHHLMASPLVLFSTAWYCVWSSSRAFSSPIPCSHVW